MTPKDLAANIWSDDQRAKECQRYYEALVGTMNRTHRDDTTQDALCVFEAVAMLLGQICGSMPAPERAGILLFVQERSAQHAIDFGDAGKAARHFIEDMN